jgi:UDP-2,4-diacetamido-2,4,6-trideoxy-beta-L-altropyranose hydrolase
MHAGFASRGLPADLAAAIRAAGMSLIDLPDDVPLHDEPQAIESRIGEPVDVLVTDHYAIGSSWQEAAARWAGTLMAIDDLADRTQAVDMLVNPNLGVGGADYVGLARPGARLLIGPRYAPLDPAFAAARRSMRPRDALGRVLVFISGSDPRDVTGRAAEAAVTLGVPVDVVVGGSYPYLARLRDWASRAADVNVHVASREMAALTARADVAVGAPGSASWERCALGLPTVLVTVADNQVGNARALAEVGAAISLGDDRSVPVEAIVAALVDLARDPARLRAMSESAASLTDGKGASRRRPAGAPGRRRGAAAAGSLTAVARPVT